MSVEAEVPAEPKRALLAFGGSTHTVELWVENEDTLHMHVTRESDGCVWSNFFSSKYVEDVTSKTGSKKKFGVFVRMLCSALSRASDSVSIDLLTYQDLEALKSRKGRASQQANSAGSLSKRYLILTHISEFERVHFPLPLEHASAESGDATAAAAHRQQGNASTSAPAASSQGESVHDALRRALNEKKELQSQVSALKRERDELSSRLKAREREIESERAEHKRELQKKAKEAESSNSELRRKREVERELRDRVKELSTELENAKNSKQRGATRNGGGSRWRTPQQNRRSSRSPASSRQGSRESTPASSRASSRERQRPQSAPNSTRNSPSPGQPPRFDPTAYVQQRKERFRGAKETQNRPSSASARPQDGRREMTQRFPPAVEGGKAGMQRRQQQQQQQQQHRQSENEESLGAQKRAAAQGKQSAKEEIADIDSRLHALQAYLSNARQSTL